MSSFNHFSLSFIKSKQAAATFSGLSIWVQCSASLIITNLENLAPFFVFIVEYLLEELEVDTSTKTDENNSAIPNNPFEIVEMIRRYNSMDDATNPSDAIDDALKSFNSLEGK